MAVEVRVSLSHRRKLLAPASAVDDGRMEIPGTRYAKTTDGVHIAYQVVGDGPLDLVFVPPWVSDVEIQWEEPRFARFLRGLASFSRLITFDKRGTGLSDRVSDDRLPDMETRMDDVRAVLDQVGSERGALFGAFDGGHMSMVFAATYPERTVALMLLGSPAKARRSSDYPWGLPEDWIIQDMAKMEAGWGGLEYARQIVPELDPSVGADQRFIEWYARYLRRGASPGAALALTRMWNETDMRGVLPAIRVPTLVLGRPDAVFPLQGGQADRYLAEQIPGAELVEVSGTDFNFWTNGADGVLDAMQRFLRNVRREEAELERVLATVLFTDIVGSTQTAAQLGDGGWRALLDRHHALVRSLLARYRGREVDVAGDGFLATFDGPARAVRCARAIADAVKPLELQIRAGVHTGEIELAGDDVRGIAVHIGARVAALAGPSEVLVSSTVKDLVAGSGLVFEDAGEHELKGVPDHWHLYRVMSV
jgi:class 3 adenylate cyclase